MTVSPSPTSHAHLAGSPAGVRPDAGRSSGGRRTAQYQTQLRLPSRAADEGQGASAGATRERLKSASRIGTILDFWA